MLKYLCTWTLLVFVVLASAKDLSKCAVRCNMYVHVPVCGYNGKEYKLFQNKCLLMTANCNEDDEWKIASVASCKNLASRTSKQCSYLKCGTEHKPVCGAVGDHFELFENDCLLRLQKCRDRKLWIVHPVSHCEGETIQQKRSMVDCPRMCPMNYSPICATDGRTNKVFSNECDLKVANCNTNRWTRTRSADCGGKEGMFGLFPEVGDNKNDLNDENDEFVCPGNCNYAANHVCAFNGEQYRIFGNECTLQLTKCRTMQNWKLKPLAECEGKDDWYFPPVMPV